MTLQNLNLKYKYETSEENVLDEFLIPCLKESFQYDRAVGFFNAKSLKLALRGLIEFLKKRNRKIRLITSPYLSEHDIKEIKKGLGDEKNILEEKLLEKIEKIANSKNRVILSSLAWLLSNGLLEMKIGDVNLPSHGLFHDKLGIFKDKEGHKVVFFGSLNETYLGYKGNYESIRVLTSWRNPKQVLEEENDFKRLWEDLDSKVKVYTLSEAIKKKILQFQPESKEALMNSLEEYGYPFTRPKETQKMNFNPKNMEPWNPQRRALKKIKENDYKGILKMATGTGKTHTAFFALEQFFKTHEKYGNRILVLVHTREIGNQWKAFLKENTPIRTPVYFYSSSITRNEKSELYEVWRHSPDDCNVFLIITIHSLDNFNFLGEKPDFFIADEVHAYGTENRMEKIKQNLGTVRNRLGLSATPSRYYDPKGTRRIFDYFGSIIFSYGIQEAQREPKKRNGKVTVLSQYKYYPYITFLSPNEEKKIERLTKKVAKALGIYSEGLKAEDEISEKKIPKSASVNMNKRARVIKKSRNKLEELKKILREHRGELTQCIVYCSDQNQLEECKKVFDEIGIDDYLPYHSSISHRGKALRLFKKKDYKFVLSIHCLDQGIDIPDAHSLILMASSGNPREYIQRRGRVLRNYIGKPPVKIFDIFSFPRSLEKKYEGLVKARLLRAWEFLRCSQTKEERRKFFKIIDKFPRITNSELKKIVRR